VDERWIKDHFQPTTNCLPSSTTDFSVRIITQVVCVCVCVSVCLSLSSCNQTSFHSIIIIIIIMSDDMDISKMKGTKEIMRKNYDLFLVKRYHSPYRKPNNVSFLTLCTSDLNDSMHSFYPSLIFCIYI
jgi:hypothetical protein